MKEALDMKSKGKTAFVVKILLSLVIGFLVVYPTIVYGRHFLIK
jgi:hypothetical protein